MTQLSSLSGWDIAKHFGCEFTGDYNPIDHGGTFYNTHNWTKYGYSDCVRFYRVPDDNDRLWVECATINRPKNLTDSYRSCDWIVDHVVDCLDIRVHIDPDDESQILVEYSGDTFEITPQVEIECVLGYWGADVCEDYSGPFVQKFADGTDEDEIWAAIAGWIKGLATE